MAFLMDILMAMFWESWIERFEEESGKFITPHTAKVRQFADEIGKPESATQEQLAKEAWLYITNNINYKLTKKWATPDGLIERGVGDCEDMVFLFASVAPHIGINQVDIVIGNLIKPKGGGGPHVWAEVDGMVIDPTGYPEDVEKMTYEQVHTFEIQYE